MPGPCWPSLTQTSSHLRFPLGKRRISPCSLSLLKKPCITLCWQSPLRKPRSRPCPRSLPRKPRTHSSLQAAFPPPAQTLHNQENPIHTAPSERWLSRHWRQLRRTRCPATGSSPARFYCSASLSCRGQASLWRRSFAAHSTTGHCLHESASAWGSHCQQPHLRLFPTPLSFASCQPWVSRLPFSPHPTHSFSAPLSLVSQHFVVLLLSSYSAPHP